MALRRRRQGPGHVLFPGFTEVSEIGIGSLAIVYRAREVATDRPVALKLLNVRDASPRAIESFERESVALGALSSHPNIVTLYRTFRAPDGRPVLVLELCTGAVSDRLRDGEGLPVQDAVAIGVKVAGALETAHRGGILHLDVKPRNILVTEFGEPALAGFGVAMLQSTMQTTAGLFDFTSLHAAPELLEGGATSAATDVYELASCLYHLVAGQSAFRAYEGESPASVILRILRDPVRPVSGAGVPVRLSDLIITAMSKDKQHRPPTAAEFAAELAEIEIAEGWPRTPFLIRDRAGAGTGRPPTIARTPVAVPPAVPGPASPPGRPAGGWVPTGEVGLGATPPRPIRMPAPALAEGRVTLAIDDEDAMPFEVPLPGTKTENPGSTTDWGAQPQEGSDLFRAVQPDDGEGPAEQFPIPPAAMAGTETAPAAPVPTWAVRPPTAMAAAAPQFVGDLAIDPSSLRPKLTVRSGLSALTVDDEQLTLRSFMHTERLPWEQVIGFEPHFPDGPLEPRARGILVALTPSGAIELPGTRRAGGELRRIHALLDAYRVRALTRSNR